MLPTKLAPTHRRNQRFWRVNSSPFDNSSSDFMKIMNYAEKGVNLVCDAKADIEKVMNGISSISDVLSDVKSTYEQRNASDLVVKSKKLVPKKR
mgnify:CR=1 FL=1